MGRDKALIEIEGVPLWRRQLRLLRELHPHEIFLAGPTREGLANAGCTIVADALPDAGPLAGLTAALQQCSTPLLLALAVDLPNITSGYLHDLRTACENGTGIVPRLADRFEPLVAIYPLASLAIAERCLDARDYSLQKFAAQCVAQGLVRAKQVDPRDAPLFLNMNSPRDLPIGAVL